MANNLPPTLPTSGSAKPPSSGPARAQDLSVAKLQQHKDREAARASIGQVMKEKAEEVEEGATTSIGRVGEPAMKATSVAHGGHAKRSVFHEEEYDEVRDRLRYQHIRQMMREKKAAEEAVAKAEKPPVYDIGIKTGGAFKLKGRGGLMKKLGKLRYQQPATYRHLSKQDQKYFADLVKPHAKGVSRWSGVGRLARTKMKTQIERDRRAGKISSTDATDMKRMIDQLLH